MKGKMFLASNILVYSSLQDNKEKHDIVLNLWKQLEGNFIFVSTQVVNEVYVSLLKHALTDKDIQNIVLKILDVCNVSVITIDSIKSAWKLKKQYNLSYWDSLIVASAMENNCDILYSEDMQDRQTLEDKLKIINPFKLNIVRLGFCAFYSIALKLSFPHVFSGNLGWTGLWIPDKSIRV